MCTINWFYNLISNKKCVTNRKELEQQKKELIFMFVGNCPSKKINISSKHFEDYGIGKYDYKKLKNKILMVTGLIKNNNYIYNNTDLKNLIETFYETKNECIMLKKNDIGEMERLYICVRNSFAHGNFFVLNEKRKKEKFDKNNYKYFLWNESSRGNISSFMILTYVHLQSIFNALNFLTEK